MTLCSIFQQSSKKVKKSFMGIYFVMVYTLHLSKQSHYELENWSEVSMHRIG